MRHSEEFQNIEQSFAILENNTNHYYKTKDDNNYVSYINGFYHIRNAINHIFNLFIEKIPIIKKNTLIEENYLNAVKLLNGIIMELKSMEKKIIKFYNISMDCKPTSMNMNIRLFVDFINKSILSKKKEFIKLFNNYDEQSEELNLYL